MQFNQTNQNQGDVNNAISEKGNVVQNSGGHDNTTSNINNATSGRGSIVQTTGSESSSKIDQPKESFWSTCWDKIKACWKLITG